MWVLMYLGRSTGQRSEGNAAHFLTFVLMHVWPVGSPNGHSSCSELLSLAGERHKECGKWCFHRKQVTSEVEDSLKEQQETTGYLDIS